MEATEIPSIFARQHGRPRGQKEAMTLQADQPAYYGSDLAEIVVRGRSGHANGQSMGWLPLRFSSAVIYLDEPARSASPTARSPDERKSLRRNKEVEANKTVRSPKAIRIRLLTATGCRDNEGLVRAPKMDFISRDDKVTWSIAQAIMSTASTEVSSTSTTLLCLMELITARLLEKENAVLEMPRTSGCLSDWQQRQVLIAIASSLHTRIPLGRLAHSCRLSTCHFARAFKKTYGNTAHQYVLERRIALARDLLSQSADSVSQIALTCGFSDQSSFSRTFAGMVGLPPAAWRRSQLKEANSMGC